MTHAPASPSIQPFTISIEETILEDLRQRLAATRWPEDSPAPSWQQGVPVSEMKRLCDYWREQYDWRRCERALNGLGQFRTAIDGVDIHFIHVRSPEPNALPMVLTHGWPGSVIEFHKVIGPLTDPVAHGGHAKDAFDVIVPSLPGFGFSGNPNSTAWSVTKIAAAWVELIRRLGYTRFVAQGGDCGALVSTEIGKLAPPELKGIHLNFAIAFPEESEMESLSDRENQSLADFKHNGQFGRGYSEIQRTKPQTLGYGLADSPVGQAAWIYDKFHDWSDCNGDPTSVFSFDEILDNIMLYWLPCHGASAARLYATPLPRDWRGNDNAGFTTQKVPLGVSVFPKEIFRPARRWMERKYGPLMYWNELERGGHFAALEQPQLFIEELRACFRPLR